MTPQRFGWLDATVFVHALFVNDPHRPRCIEVLESLESGEGEGWIDAIVVHELTYVLPRALPKKFSNRAAVAEYLLSFLALRNLHANNKDALIATLQRWSVSQVAFADARLLTLGEAHSLPICTVNKRDFPDIPNTF